MHIFPLIFDLLDLLSCPLYQYQIVYRPECILKMFLCSLKICMSCTCLSDCSAPCPLKKTSSTAISAENKGIPMFLPAPTHATAIEASTGAWLESVTGTGVECVAGGGRRMRCRWRYKCRVSDRHRCRMHCRWRYKCRSRCGGKM